MLLRKVTNTEPQEGEDIKSELEDEQALSEIEVDIEKPSAVMLVDGEQPVPSPVEGAETSAKEASVEKGDTDEVVIDEPVEATAQADPPRYSCLSAWRRYFGHEVSART